MKKHELEKMLRESTELTPKDSLKDRVMAESEALKRLNPDEKSQAKEKKPAKKTVRFRPILAATLVLLIVFSASFGGFKIFGEACETVFVDVNPSVEFSLNRAGKIINVSYLNDDARESLKDTDIKGKSAEEGLTLIMQSLHADGYMSDAEITISVYSKKSDNGDKLISKLEKEARDFSHNNSCNATVICQKLTKEEQEAAKENGISPSKARYMKEIMKLSDKYTEKELSEMKVKELRLLLSELKKNNK